MIDTLKEYQLLARTAAGKTPRQLAGILHRKARNRVLPRLPVDFDRQYQQGIPTDLDSDPRPYAVDTARLRSALSNEERKRYRTLATDFADGQVTFLNRSRDISDPASVSPSDDRIQDLPRLWYLKLAGFEPVRWGVLGYDSPADSEEFSRKVEKWLANIVRQEAIASRPGYLRGFWTPYAVSLRVVTLCRYAGWLGGLPSRVTEFFYKNLLFLNQNVERDVGGNHLFENGTALVVGGAAFPEHGDRFVETGLEVLESTVGRQFLEDGYHYERSPMYHLAITTRLLTALSVLEETDRAVPEWLRNVCTRVCSYLSYLRSPDGRIPLLNDSVFDETERLDTVMRYADSINIPPQINLKKSAVVGESDLYWLSSNQLTMLLDAGDSGPPEQLAHTHNDPGTVLAWYDNTRMITDTGTFDYQPGKYRDTARSVRAHNTVQVGETEPATYGGRFQMSKPVETTTDWVEREDVDGVVVEYTGGEDGRYAHRRICYEGLNWLLVWDGIDADNGNVVQSHTSRIQAHPAVSVEGGSPYRFVHDDGSALSVQPFDADKTAVETGQYFPRFGEARDRDVVVLRSDTGQSGYLLTPETVEAELDRTGELPNGVHIDGDFYRLPTLEG